MTDLETSPTVADALAQAVQWLNTGQTAEGRALLSAIVEAHPDVAEAHLLIAAELAEDQNWDAADAAFERAVSLAPELTVARFQWGLLAYSRDLRARAIEILEPLASASDPALAGYAAALVHDASGRRNDAIAALDSALAKPQAIPALTLDMQRLLTRWQSDLETTSDGLQADPLAAQAFLDAYGKH